MGAHLIDGKAIAQQLRERIAQEVADLKAQRGLVPGLAVVLVGEDAASQVYVGSKEKMAVAVGMHSVVCRLEATTSEAEVLAKVEALNADPTIDGILVQLPLPAHIDEDKILLAIDPDKDVDGFHPVNVGRLSIGQSNGEHGMVPCTPKGCLMLLKGVLGDLTGKTALVIGRSNIVGKPMAQLLLSANCTVTLAHSRSRDLPDLCRRMDIVVAAVGRPEMVKGDWLKPGAVVIDVGMNRLPAAPGAEKGKLVGDVDYASAAAVAGAITPVPGGVGPMTIACLLANTLEACKARGAGA
ncbi:bifunctional methylenetetrahydrofolate dehydrogenase/methenyltetrahydrofolate cyclohydrolase [Rhodospirillum rubrum]|uniref:bifunctional methylenetetrahydrofolate dehydrogenase/methenyltetrahydrofolate cyclohydrolase FolD n=1 Tax=Rhodospirillum rubrum TaxID=1085 RepID=UPI001905EA4E|nr:bifunctional methylenetetrahydrofolate dehydrogenase/methenyltetrahydrofolate cyclohydrolase FolD [Rhodospirillum rubrum]MBK1664241.1 bifunctional methylenetetrahydrofolate dehydrogenase/methenyltetrahydrofolate cyclohydrolase [Rhodospirillum rubrum]MBK1675341.1 bifunctional methylenetetrahydrofolate dehydrogenase/methenyltetrahydrofolate cyclohydrolase [Rhodospirillum rubrum]